MGARPPVDPRSAAHAAAFLYLLGRRVSTAIRVRWGDREIQASRAEPPPLAAIADALQAPDPVEADPWVDLPDGGRGLACLWAFADAGAGDEALDAIPAQFRPQVEVVSGSSRVLVWLLDRPAALPGGSDPARALALIAEAIGARPGDPRDFLPLPRSADDLRILDAHASASPEGLLAWAEEVVAERKRQAALERDLEPPRPVALDQPPVPARALEREPRSREDGRDVPAGPEDDGDTARVPVEAPARATRGTDAGNDGALLEAPGGAIEDRTLDRPPQAAHPDAIEPPGPAPSAAPEGAGRVESARPGAAAPPLPPLAASLLSEIAAACRADPDGILVVALAREAMRRLGTQRAWEILGVSATRDDGESLWGLRGDAWVRIGP